MSNYTDCPNCGTEIDATAAALTGYCPECDTAFNALVRMETDGENDPAESGPHHQIEP